MSDILTYLTVHSGVSLLDLIGFSCVFKVIWNFLLILLEINFNFKELILEFEIKLKLN